MLLSNREARGMLSVASVASAVLMLLLGLIYFQRAEQRFADVV